MKFWLTICYWGHKNCTSVQAFQYVGIIGSPQSIMRPSLLSVKIPFVAFLRPNSEQFHLWPTLEKYVIKTLACQLLKVHVWESDCYSTGPYPGCSRIQDRQRQQVLTTVSQHVCHCCHMTCKPISDWLWYMFTD